MMNINSRDLGFGALAGVATLFLAAGTIYASGLGIILLFMAPLPVLLATLDRGVSVGIIGAVFAAIGLIVLTSPAPAIFITFAATLPALMAGFWLSLARPASELGGPQDQIVWYPLSDVLFRVALMIASAFIIAGILIGYGPELTAEMTDIFATTLREANPDLNLTPEAETQLIAFVVNSTPFLLPAMWFMLFVLNLYIALAIARSRGNLKRPADVWPIALRMPRAAMIVLAGAMAGTFLAGGIALAATAIVGALIAAFTMAGFAVFHAYSMGKDWRPIGMVVVYGSVILIGFTAFIFTFVGMFNLARNMPISPASGGQTPPSQ